VTTFLRLLPAGFATLLLGAHFFRARQLVEVALCLTLFALLFVARAWAARAVQVALAVGVVVWLRTAWLFAAERRALGLPSARLWLILGGVAAFTALAAWLLEARARALAARSAAPPAA
jgi:hypothetical protein